MNTMTDIDTTDLEAIEGGSLLALALGAFVFWSCMDDAKDIVEGARDGWSRAMQ